LVPKEVLATNPEALTIEQKPVEKVQRAKPDPKTIERILNSQPLKDKYKDILPPEMLLPIGSRQTKLLDKVYCMERSINFLVLREHKVTFFCDLKKQVEDCMKVTITMDDLQKIVFLAPSFYNISWEKHDRLKKYDLIIKKPCT
jgi:hypothetical protein